jgi:hypothetical protein
LNWKLAEERRILDSVPVRYVEGTEAFYKSINDNTLRSWFPIWKENLAVNKRFDFDKFSAREFKGKMKGPAFIVGAGPSLKEDAVKLRGRKTIFATGHSLKCLLENGVKPDFAVLIDAKDVQGKYLDIGEYSKDITLLTDILVHPSVFDIWKGPVRFFIADQFQEVKDEIKKVTDFDVYISTGGNVAGASEILAQGFGHSEIIYVGCDLNNGQCPTLQYAINPTESEDKIFYDPWTATHWESFLACRADGVGVEMMSRMWPYKSFFEACAIKFGNGHTVCCPSTIGAYVEGNLKCFKYKPLEEVEVGYVRLHRL